MVMFELSYILVVLIWIVFDVENCEVSSAEYLFHTIPTSCAILPIMHTTYSLHE